VGGALRMSKSEGAMPPVSPPLLVFHSSDWAEEVGIEPPPWRSGGPAIYGPPQRRGGGGRCGVERTDDDNPYAAPGSKAEVLPSAGSGAPLRPVPLHYAVRTSGPFALAQDACSGARVMSRLPAETQTENAPSTSSGHCMLLKRVPCT
jgi:hypothetical protein